MRATSVKIDPPPLKHESGTSERADDLVDRFIAQTADERFNEGIPLRLAGLLRANIALRGVRSIAYASRWEPSIYQLTEDLMRGSVGRMLDHFGHRVQ
jgi:hypothetical protein